MLSALAALLLTWAAVYAYVGMYYCVLHARRPSHREYLAFGLMTFGLCVWSIGAALAADASVLESARFALRIQYLGGFVAAAYFTDFAMELVGRPAPWVRRACYAICGGGIVADAAGLLFDQARRAPPMAFRLFAAADRVEPVFTLPGRLLIIVAIAFGAWGVWTIARGTGKYPDLRMVMWATALAVLAAIHDTAARIGRVHSVYLLEHVALLPVLTVSFVLLRRFVAAADQLAERTQELRRSYGELHVMQEEVVRKEQLAAVGELSAVIAHEVRNPLAIIKNAVSSLRRPTLRSSDRGVLLSILDEEVDRLNRLMRDLLSYARPVPPRGRPIDLREVIGGVVDALRQRLQDDDRVEIQVEAEPLPTVNGDAELLGQALMSVADNALQAMPSGGTLTIRAAGERHNGGAQVAIEIIDTGEGMDASVCAKARDPFFTTRPAGTGLGLAIVERVIKNHGGRMSIQSEPGLGTTVRIVLPRERPSSIPPAAEHL